MGRAEGSGIAGDSVTILGLFYDCDKLNDVYDKLNEVKISCVGIIPCPPK